VVMIYAHALRFVS